MSFSSSGCLTFGCAAAVDNFIGVDYLVVAGGGGGGGSDHGGGGGAGGYRTSFPSGTKAYLSAGPNAVTIGAGGAGQSSDDGIYWFRC